MLAELGSSMSFSLYYSTWCVNINRVAAIRMSFPARMALIFLSWGVSLLATADEIDFNRDVKPILSENCFFCHGQDANHRQGDLRLDQAESAIGSGAIVPGSSQTSPLIERILSDDPETRMPPSESNRSLTDAQKEILKRWVDQGAKFETHWAFVPPRRAEVPKFEANPSADRSSLPHQPSLETSVNAPVEAATRSVDASNWIRNPIDAFVLQKLNSIGLEPSPPADRATLIKRLYADLVGLPPSPQQVDAFVNDADPVAYEELVDQLLSSPHYGERMALAWLDAARYADSNGFQQDGDTWQWIWRDWVVKALNEDMPFDQFSIWQLAGDLLDNPTTEQQVATAFNRNHLLNGEGGGIAEEQRFVVLFDRMDTTSTNWLGMTIACAQCHSHKYDPVSQKEYYQLLDMFNRVPEVGRPEEIAPIRFRLDTPYLEFPTDDQQQHIAELNRQLELAKSEGTAQLKLAYDAWELGVLSSDPAHNAYLSDELKTLLDKPESERTEREKQTLKNELKKHFDDKVRHALAESHPALKSVESLQKQLHDYHKSTIPRVMVMSDAQPRQTHVLNRGQYLEPLEPVSFDVPAFLPPLPADLPRNRLGFARWLFRPENPLVARVQVNRIWQHFFGSGFVKTSEDFGMQSEYPVHRELLDWLAVEFRENGWSVKKLQRLILTSSTYQQSSRLTPHQRERDPENRYYGRASRFRMPAMILRDWALGSSGLLNDQMGGAPVYPYQPEGVWESLAITKERDFSYPQSSGSDLFRRSLYSFWRRTISPANMFDASNRQACRVRASISNTPLHALTTLNDPTWVEASLALAVVCLSKHEQRDAQLQEAFQRVLCRQPTPTELTSLKELWQNQLKFYQANSPMVDELLSVRKAPISSELNRVSVAVMANVCLAILNLDEALTRE
jgi:hypothetical protein